MMDRAKISANQLFWLLVITEMATTGLVTIRATLAISKQDTWIGVLCGGLMAVLITLVVVQASLQNSTQTIVESMRRLVGKFGTGFLVVPYLVVGIAGIGLNLKQFMSFVHLALFDHTPQWVTICIFLLVIVYITHQGGIEGIARCAQLIGPCVILTTCLVVVLNINYLDYNQLLPIYYDSGWNKILHTSIMCTAFFCQTCVLFMLVPFINRPDQVRRATLWALAVVIILMLLSLFALIALFGPDLSSRMLNPMFELSRFISSMEFIENVDSIVVVFWIMAYFVTFAMYLFLMSYGIGEWLGMKDWRKALWVISILVLCVALIPTRMDVTSAMMKYMGVFVTVVIINAIVIPGGLFGANVLQKRKGRKRLSKNR